ncbi:MAG TPA: EutN/CcmL family microcompartment protein [Phycisphaerae bacterium]|nr:EutN/CcmL family microcompartment protein [Phycisphaerae bacterium]
MRIARVIGKLVLSRSLPDLVPGSFLVVRPLDRQSLAGDRKGGPITLVEYDNLGARADDLTGMVEGREATQPFRPAKVPYDAYCACILDSVNFQPVLEVA